MLMDGAQDVRVRAAFAAADLHIESIVVVRPRPDRAPRFRGNVGCVEKVVSVESSLVVRDESGAYTPAMRAVRARFGAHQT